MVPTRLSPLVWDRPQGHELHLGDRDPGAARTSTPASAPPGHFGGAETHATIQAAAILLPCRRSAMCLGRKANDHASTPW